MSDSDSNERDDSDVGAPGADDQVCGLHLKVGLRSLTGLLGNLPEVHARKSPPPPGNPGHWRAVDVESGGQQDGDDTSEHERTEQGQTVQSDEHLIDTRIDDNEFIVTADIPGATKDDLSVGIHPRTNNLVIGRNGTVIRRVHIPWTAPEATHVWFNNGVLEVRLRSSETD